MDQVEHSGILKYTNQIIQASPQIESFKYLTIKIFVNLLSESFQHLHTSRKIVSKKEYYKKLFSLTLLSQNYLYYYFFINGNLIYIGNLFSYR